MEAVNFGYVDRIEEVIKSADPLPVFSVEDAADEAKKAEHIKALREQIQKDFFGVLKSKYGLRDAERKFLMKWGVIFFPFLTGKKFSLLDLVLLFSQVVKECEDLTVTFDTEFLVSMFLESLEQRDRNRLSTEITKVQRGAAQHTVKVTSSWKVLKTFLLEWLDEQVAGDANRKTDSRLTLENYLKWVESLRAKTAAIPFSAPSEKKQSSARQGGGVVGNGADPATVIKNTEMETAKQVGKRAKRNAVKRVGKLMRTYSNQMSIRKFGGQQHQS
uniref:Uncharacterized protein n=1 Tax=Chromera velia CCMP2878 TaxID=1169474 RepID=A0A0G4G4D8_9ALVE|eukprot:Cvel_20217.t1-p1 / transcript=Cvel_20217.t1 / gene=Cvel_20217 / organism=Chromera_velia_CCMP2878 / gene_product=hypothetical protein / transcript_product=hypothetical protein / location=Cvel_scaffold1799:35732-37114(+) / protein_length=273 / sequence_SO=supercontig / SO=protein_coding / is_pseudo=false